MQAILTRLRSGEGLSPDEITAEMKKNGITKLWFAWDPQWMPYAIPTIMPNEGLHLFCDGISRSQGAREAESYCPAAA